MVRVRLVLLGCMVALMLVLAVLWIRKPGAEVTPPSADAATKTPHIASPSGSRTAVYAHNVRLHQGPQFVVYIPWLRGAVARTHRNISPSFDDLDSFNLVVTNGILRANLGDMSNHLNSVNTNSPLKNIVVTGNGSEIKIRGTLHKVISLPIELTGTLTAIAGNRIQMRVTKINVLKIPLKALLGDFRVKVADLFHSDQIPGIAVSGNDIVFDPQTLLPPPRIQGALTSVTIRNPDLEAVYGDVREDVKRTEEWRNYLHLTGGEINFGRLTMNPVDLIMIDVSQDSWFDLDLSRYQEQLVNGYTRMTPQAGLQIFMPDVSKIPVNKANQSISLEWLKNRNVLPPSNLK